MPVQTAHENQSATDRVLLELKELHRMREDWVRARTALTNRIKAQERRLAHRRHANQPGVGQQDNGRHGPVGNHVCGATEDVSGHGPVENHSRRAAENGAAGDHLKADNQAASVATAAALPLLEARALIESHMKPLEKRIAELAKQLPVWPWVEDIRGVGALLFGQLIAETGDLINYENPAKVWKRMGVAVIAGERQQKKSDPTEAEDHGYSPRRRSLLWNIGECLVKLNQEGRYRTTYLERKEYELSRPWCGKCRPKGSKGEREHCIPGHAHNRAKRYMEKRFLKDLWTEWTGQKKRVNQKKSATTGVAG